MAFFLFVGRGKSFRVLGQKDAADSCNSSKLHNNAGAEYSPRDLNGIFIDFLTNAATMFVRGCLKKRRGLP